MTTFCPVERETTIAPPVVSEDEVRALVTRLYGLTVSRMRKLDSYDDLNYHVHVEEEAETGGYVLKVINGFDSMADKFQDAHVQVMVHLRRNGIPCPDVVRNVRGEYHSRETYVRADTGVSETYSVCMITFERGTMLKNVSYGPSCLYKVGKLLADIHLCLKNFNHSGLNEDRMTMLWQYQALPSLAQFVSAIEDPGREQMVRDALIHAINMADVIQKVPHGALHGDYNEMNILVEESTPGDHEITCVLDFSDSHYGPYAYCLATSIAYLMIAATSIDPLLVGGHVIAGYSSRRILDVEELKVVHAMVGARFCQSLALGSFKAQQTPENKEYLMQTSARGWGVFENFCNTPTDVILKKWNGALSEHSYNSKNVQ